MKEACQWNVTSCPTLSESVLECRNLSYSTDEKKNMSVPREMPTSVKDCLSLSDTVENGKNVGNDSVAMSVDPLSKLPVPPKTLTSVKKLPYMKDHIDWCVQNSDLLTREEPLHQVVDEALQLSCDLSEKELRDLRARNVSEVDRLAK